MFYGHALSSATREERKIFPNHAGHLFAPESSLALSCIGLSPAPRVSYSSSNRSKAICFKLANSTTRPCGQCC